MLEDKNNRHSDSSPESKATEQEYKVGPGRPPREYQFKKGQSGNPKGAKRKKPSIELDLKLALEHALNNPVTLKQGGKEHTVTMAIAGIEQCVAQFAKGDKNARRDVFTFASRLGVDLVASAKNGFSEALAPHHEAILEAYVDRQYCKYEPSKPVIAPEELRDDDPEDKKGN